MLAVASDLVKGARLVVTVLLDILAAVGQSHRAVLDVARSSCSVLRLKLSHSRLPRECFDTLAAGSGGVRLDSVSPK